MDHKVRWVTASPLWDDLRGPDFPAGLAAFRRPALLRFASDAFMTDFLALAQADPAGLKGHRAGPETWRSLAPLPVPATPPPKFARSMGRPRPARSRNGHLATAIPPSPATVTVAAAGPLKLYQPAHQRYYLLTASLVCQMPGLPDRALDTSAEERVSFVVRRLLPRPGATYSMTEVDASSCDEYAFVTSGRVHGWRPVAAPGGPAAVAAPGEERHPLFAVNYAEANGHPRRLLAGLVPVGKRETYLGAMALPPGGGDPVPDPSVPASDPRIALLLAQVVEPWKNLVRRALAVRAIINPSSGGPPVLTPLVQPPALTPPATLQDLSDLLVAGREQIQAVSWYILLDLAKYLRASVPEVWAAVNDPSRAAALSSAARPLYDWLAGLAIGADLALTTGVKKNMAAPVANAPDLVATSLAAALRAVGAFEGGLEATVLPYQRSPAPPPAGYPYPTFLFPLADPMSLNSASKAMPQFSQHVDPLTPLVQAALPALPPDPSTAVPLAARVPLDPRVGWFVIRCVYDRPYCGPLDPPVVSDPTPPFQMAAFFDPDAPARPLRIALPLDTSPAGLRKYDKNAAFLISDVLCNQLSGLNNLTLGDLVLSVLPWPFHKDLDVDNGGDGSCPPGIGSICTFSLPIITICAMILLLIMVKLLDIALFWIAFFRICLPLPNFKGKD